MTPEPHQPERGKMRDAVADLMQEVKEKRALTAAEKLAAAAVSQRRKRLQYLYLMIATVVFGSAVVWAIPRWKTPYAAPAGAAAEDGARQTLLFAARLIEGFRASNGRYPDTIAETGVNLPGLTYTRTPTSWELSAPIPGASPMVLRSADYRP